MTDTEALEKAKQRFGDCAFVLRGRNMYFIGETNGPLRNYVGRGKTWEAAFEDVKLNLN